MKRRSVRLARVGLLTVFFSLFPPQTCRAASIGAIDRTSTKCAGLERLHSGRSPEAGARQSAPRPQSPAAPGCSMPHAEGADSTVQKRFDRTGARATRTAGACRTLQQREGAERIAT